ncbi:MAG: lipoate--protein ligase family protein [Syntrophales bacterium]
MDVWRLLPFRKGDPAENMAVDEAVFRGTIRKASPPTLRFYGWRTPAVSIGRFQDVRTEVNVEACRRLGIGIVRRPTGGKAVLHDEELTYAVTAGGDSPLFPPDILETYRIVSSCIARGLAGCGIRAEMEADGRSAADEPLERSCFSLPSRYELLVSGRKICGSAQTRSHGVFLQHGALLMAFDPGRTCAVLLPDRDRERQIDRLRNAVTSVREHATIPSVDEETLSRIIRDGFTQVLGIRFREGVLTSEEEALRDELMTKKYSSASWNGEGRDPWISGL